MAAQNSTTGRLDVTTRGVHPGIVRQGLLMDAIQEAVETNQELFLPGSPTAYQITRPLHWRGPTPRISGQGVNTTIQPDANDYDWLVIGTGAGNGSGPGNGWVRDLRIIGANTTLAPAGNTAGFLLDGVRGVEVTNVEVRYSPIGFDMRRNCFGSSFYNCRTLFDTCRVGLLLRGPNSGGGSLFGAGNDIPFTNCWLMGREAAVWVEPNSANYTITGGQLGIVNPTVSDDRANVVMNKMFDTGEVMAGGTNLQFFGTSFEPTDNAWVFRAMAGGVSITLVACSLIGRGAAMGVCKIAGTPGFAQGGNDHLTMINTGVHGTWTLSEVAGVPQWVVLNTNVAGTISPHYFEAGTYTSGALNVNGVTTLNLGIEGFLMGSRAHNRCHAMMSQYWMHNTCRFRRAPGAPSSTAVQVSYDHGVTWNEFTTTPVA